MRINNKYYFYTYKESVQIYYLAIESKIVKGGTF